MFSCFFVPTVFGHFKFRYRKKNRVLSSVVTSSDDSGVIRTRAFFFFFFCIPDLVRAFNFRICCSVYSITSMCTRAIRVEPDRWRYAPFRSTLLRSSGWDLLQTYDFVSGFAKTYLRNLHQARLDTRPYISALRNSSSSNWVAVAATSAQGFRREPGDFLPSDSLYLRARSPTAIERHSEVFRCSVPIPDRNSPSEVIPSHPSSHC